MSEEAKEFFVTWKDMNEILQKLQTDTLTPLQKAVSSLSTGQKLIMAFLGMNIFATVIEMVLFLRK